MVPSQNLVYTRNSLLQFTFGRHKEDGEIFSWHAGERKYTVLQCHKGSPKRYGQGWNIVPAHSLWPRPNFDQIFVVIETRGNTDKMFSQRFCWYFIVFFKNLLLIFFYSWHCSSRMFSLWQRRIRGITRIRWIRATTGDNTDQNNKYLGRWFLCRIWCFLGIQNVFWIL